MPFENNLKKFGKNNSLLKKERNFYLHKFHRNQFNTHQSANA